MSKQRQDLEELRARCEELYQMVSTRNSEVEHLKQANLHAQRDIEHLRGAVSERGAELRGAGRGEWDIRLTLACDHTTNCLGQCRHLSVAIHYTLVSFPHVCVCVQLQCTTSLSRHRSSNTASPFPSTSDSPDLQDQSARVVSKWRLPPALLALGGDHSVKWFETNPLQILMVVSRVGLFLHASTLP